LGVVVGNCDTRAKPESDVHTLLTKKFGDNIVFPMTMNRSVKHREATVYGKSIFEPAQEEPAAEQYLALTREVTSCLETQEAIRTRSPIERMKVNRWG
jgi:cellulose biosynthesis protein BcsQ